VRKSAVSRVATGLIYAVWGENAVWEHHDVTMNVEDATRTESLAMNNAY